ncbi:multidrug transporter, partial [Lactobacillus helveticus]|nr:multidrug transporter [Lactobacillus helveticus]
ATPAAMIIVFSYYKIILIQVAVTVIFLGLDNFLWNLGVRRYDGAGR